MGLIQPAIVQLYGDILGRHNDALVYRRFYLFGSAETNKVLYRLTISVNFTIKIVRVDLQEGEQYE
ncbi:hypothetical protein AB4Z45_21565 [Paenibacillus sp. MCAF9]